MHVFVACHCGKEPVHAATDADRLHHVGQYNTESEGEGAGDFHQFLDVLIFRRRRLET